MRAQAPRRGPSPGPPGEPRLAGRGGVSRAVAGAAPLRTIRLAPGADLAGFRAAVRRLVAESVPPERVAWASGEAPGLFGAADAPAAGAAAAELRAVALPRAVADLVPMVVPHSDPERYALLYALIWRILGGERQLLEIASDPLVHRLALMRKAIQRDLHNMHAFLRFRRVAEDAGTERFVAWFEPEHHILEAAAPFFVERFRALRWTILTPEASATWDGAALRFGPPGRREDVPPGDGFEAGWRDYYESTFNPARTNLRAMRAEMPQKDWHNMPETAAIPGLIRAASARTTAMIEREPQMPTKRQPPRAVAAMA